MNKEKLKRVVFTVAVIFTIFFICSEQVRAVVISDDSVSLESAKERGYRDVFTISHRGYSAEAPENTMPAFRLSAEKGFKYIETDVRFTSDGVAVLSHDNEINRTARYKDGSEIYETINISDTTYKELLNYDFGVWFDEIYAGTSITRFDEFIDFCKKENITPVIELKHTGIPDSNLISGLLKTVKAAGLDKNALWIAFFTETDALQMIRDEDSDANFLISADELTLANNNITYEDFIRIVSDWSESGGTIFAGTDYYFLSYENINTAKNYNIPLVAWTINNELDLAYLDEYVSGIMSDYLDAETVLNEGFVFDISYDLSGGYAENITSYTRDTETFSLATPMKKGYSFEGWIGTGLEMPTKIVEIPKGTRGDLSFTAIWDKNNTSMQTITPTHFSDTISSGMSSGYYSGNTDIDDNNKKAGVHMIVLPIAIPGAAVALTIIIILVSKLRKR